jgi:hypothetical protein
VYRGDEPVFFGATLPQEGTVARLLAAMIEGEPAGAAVPEAIAALPRLLRGRR